MQILCNCFHLIMYLTLEGAQRNKKISYRNADSREKQERPTAEKAQTDLLSRQETKAAEEAKRREKIKQGEMALEHAKLEKENDLEN